MPPEEQKKFYKFQTNGDTYLTAQQYSGGFNTGYTPLTAAQVIQEYESYSPNQTGLKAWSQSAYDLAKSVASTATGGGTSGYIINPTTGVQQLASEYKRTLPGGMDAENALAAKNLAIAQAENPLYLRAGETTQQYSSRLTSLGYSPPMNQGDTAESYNARIASLRNPIGSISSTSLTGSAPSFKNEPALENYDVSGLSSDLSPDLMATPQEKKISAETDAIRAQQSQLLGETAYRQGEEQKAGLPELTR